MTKMHILYGDRLFLCNFASKMTILFIIDSFYNASNVNISKQSPLPPPWASSSSLGLHIYVHMCVHSEHVPSYFNYRKVIYFEQRLELGA